MKVALMSWLWGRGSVRSASAAVDQPLNPGSLCSLCPWKIQKGNESSMNLLLGHANSKCLYTYMV